VSLVSQLYSRRCEIWAGEVARQILGSENLDASTSQEMMIFFSQLKPRQDVVNAVETVDRIFWIDGIVYHTDDFIDAQKLLPHSDFYFIDNLYKYLTIDWNGVLIQFNRDIDQLVELCKIEDDHQLKVGEDVPISSDDLSIRLPLIQSESPTFLWADWQKYRK